MTVGDPPQAGDGSQGGGTPPRPDTVASLLAAYDRGDIDAYEALNRSDAIQWPHDGRHDRDTYDTPTGVRVVRALIDARDRGYPLPHTSLAGIAGAPKSTFAQWVEAVDDDRAAPRKRVFAGLYARLQGQADASAMRSIADDPKADAGVKLKYIQGVRQSFSEKQWVRPATVNVQVNQQQVFDAFRDSLAGKSKISRGYVRELEEHVGSDLPAIEVGKGEREAQVIDIARE